MERVRVRVRERVRLIVAVSSVGRREMWALDESGDQLDRCDGGSRTIIRLTSFS